jgi:hypothetical protein
MILAQIGAGTGDHLPLRQLLTPDIEFNIQAENKLLKD